MTAAGLRRSAPVATIDHRALRANVEALLVRGDGGYSVADLRHDAWGHGVVPVARTLEAAGVDAVVVDALDVDRVAAEVAGTGVTSAGVPTLDPAGVYGLPGSGGEPVLRLSGFVLLTKELRAGEGVSYGFAHRAKSDTRIALVAGGYAQGVVRGLGDRVSVSIGGAPCRIVGRVAMDVCVVEIGDTPARRGDEVVFFGASGEGPSLADWVAATGLTAAELVTAVGLRAQREHAA